MDDLKFQAMTINLFDEVFDNEGNVKVVGREKCKTLIRAFSFFFPNVDFGDRDTGFMNTSAIIKYAQLLKSR